MRLWTKLAIKRNVIIRLTVWPDRPSRNHSRFLVAEGFVESLGRLALTRAERDQSSTVLPSDAMKGEHERRSNTLTSRGSHHEQSLQLGAVRRVLALRERQLARTDDPTFFIGRNQ